MSVALLRSSTVMSRSPRRTESAETAQVTAERNEEEIPGDGAVVEDLRAHITALEAELDGLRYERERMQQVIDSMETETLPEYDEVDVFESMLSAT